MSRAEHPDDPFVSEPYGRSWRGISGTGNLNQRTSSTHTAGAYSLFLPRSGTAVAEDLTPTRNFLSALRIGQDGFTVRQACSHSPVESAAPVVPLDTIEEPIEVGFGNNLVPVPAAVEIADMASKINPEGPCYFGRDGQGRTTLWCYGEGTIVAQLLTAEGSAPPAILPARFGVIGRRISNSLVIPDGGRLWRNGVWHNLGALCAGDGRFRWGVAEVLHRANDFPPLLLSCQLLTVSDSPAQPRITTDIQVMFFDTDCAAVVHNIAYLRFIEIARTLLAEQLGMGLAEMAASQEFPVVVRTEIDYRKPARLGDKLVVHGWLDEFDRLRFWCAFKIVRPADGALIATSRQMLALIKMPTGRPMRLPADWPERFLKTS